MITAVFCNLARFVLRMRIFCIVKLARMTSSQPSRSSAYSEDLRWKIIWQRFSLELPVKSVARNLSIDESTVRHLHFVFERYSMV